MKVLVVSDIHANLLAFEAVIQDAEKQGGFDEIWCLGDIVGYGPDPNGCVDLLRSCPHVMVAGNHDWAVAGKLDLKWFSSAAARAVQWTRGVVRDDVREYLVSLPTMLVRGGCTLVHGSPRDPIREYVSSDKAASMLSHLTSAVLLVGHTHIPMSYQPEQGMDLPGYSTTVVFWKSKALVNPGSVGQPRDGDPQASYGILDIDAGTFSFGSVGYDVETVQKAIYAAGLPAVMAHRLALGS